MDFTIYRGEIQKYTKEIRRFTRISPIYTKTPTKHDNLDAQCIYRLLITEMTHQRCKLTNLQWYRIDQTNTDYRCPLKWGNTQSALHLVHNTYIYWKLQIDKYTNIKDLIEIHGFHNIAEWNPRKYWGNPQNDKDFRVKYCKYCMNLEQI